MDDVTRPDPTVLAPTTATTRRRKGAGSIYHDGESWVVSVKTTDGQKHRRRARDRQEARSRLTELIRELRPLLSYNYRYWLAVNKRKRREGLKPSVRFDVLHRDGFRCVYCGATAKTTTLHVDHIVPVVRGGTDHPSNLATACIDCNQGKADKELSV